MMDFYRHIMMRYARNRGYTPKGLICRYEAYKGSNEAEQALGTNAKHYLKDLSGNGHDIKLFNFGWSEGSGYGKYGMNYETMTQLHDRADFIVNGNTINITKVKKTLANIIYHTYAVGDYANYYIKVKGLPKGSILYAGGLKNNKLQIIEDGIYKAKIESINGAGTLGFNFGNLIDSCDITIEQIPEYQGALVSDGVDDYGLTVDKIPKLRPSRGYTICAIRSYISKKWSKPRMLLSTPGAGSELEFAENNTAFYSFNSETLFPAININKDTSFIFQTSATYNGILNLNKGSQEGGDSNLCLFGQYYLEPRRLGDYALYALEIYDHDLTPEEIEKVKARMLYKYWKNQGADPKLPNWFNEAVVCYYDPKKQGLTNDELSADANTANGGQGYSILKDFSHNHLDMKLHNFSGGGMSGMDGYPLNLVFFEAGGSAIIDDKTNNKITFHLKTLFQPRIQTSEVQPKKFRIRVSGIVNDNILKFSYYNGSSIIDIKTNMINGEYLIEDVPQDVTAYYFILNNAEINDSVTIEQLPLYPDALVFDGTDDYGISDNQPILTDYTVMCKRRIIQINKDSPLASKGVPGKNGVFLFETYISYQDRGKATFSFGKNILLSDYETDDISVQSTNQYNGLSFDKGAIQDVSDLVLAKQHKNGNSTSSFALYQFLLFDRTLTEKQMAWVRKYIMGETEQKQITE